MVSWDGITKFYVFFHENSFYEASIMYFSYVVIVYRNENAEHQFCSEPNNNKISASPAPSEYENDPYLSTHSKENLIKNFIDLCCKIDSIGGCYRLYFLTKLNAYLDVHHMFPTHQWMPHLNICLLLSLVLLQVWMVLRTMPLNCWEQEVTRALWISKEDPKPTTLPIHRG